MEEQDERSFWNSTSQYLAEEINERKRDQKAKLQFLEVGGRVWMETLMEESKSILGTEKA